MIPLYLYILNEDLQAGLDVRFTDYNEAVAFWEQYHLSFADRHLPTELGQYLYDVEPFFIAYANRNNIPINASNFWIFATGEHIKNALERIPTDTSTIPKWNDYINVMKEIIETNTLISNTEAKQNIFSVLDDTLKKSKEDIEKGIEKTKEALDPRESILPFLIAGVVLLALTR